MMSNTPQDPAREAYRTGVAAGIRSALRVARGASKRMIPADDGTLIVLDGSLERVLAAIEAHAEGVDRQIAADRGANEVSTHDR